MTAAEFKRKWSRFTGKESSAYQEHFNDLCRLLGQPTPAEADPSGTDFFCFQKHVVKHAELFEFHEGNGGETGTSERGFADVWKKNCFATPDVARPVAHKKLDAAVAAAYGWNDLAEVLGPNPPGFYDFKDKSWMLLEPPGAKDFEEFLRKYEQECNEQILGRLLALNLERAAEEAKAAKVKKTTSQRTKHAEELI